MTDAQLIEHLAARVMGWDVHNVSAHRPGDRKYPHAWRQALADGGRRLMVYTRNPPTNREFNPLESEADARELSDAAIAHGMQFGDEDLATADGRRRRCELAAQQSPDPAAAAWTLWLRGHGVQESELTSSLTALLRKQFEQEQEEHEDVQR